MTIITNPRWNTSEPQFYADEWRKAIRRLDYCGRCVVCNRRTYAFEDGENDPRGILGDHAADPLEPEGYDSTGPTIPFCFLCGNNDARTYERGLAIAREYWTERKAVSK